MSLESQMLVESLQHEIKRANLATANRMMAVAKSTVPGLKRVGGKRVATPTAQRAKRAPVENEAGKTAPSEIAKVSLHGYLKLEKGQRLTPADLDKAERKAKREGNQAIIDRVNAVRHFVEKKGSANRDSETGKRVTRGYAVYRGIKQSPKVSGKKSLKALAIGFGQLEYYYIPGDKRFSIEGLDKKLSAAFKSNPTEAAVLVNKLAREKKLLILLRWDTANKREHVPAHAVTAYAAITYTDRDIEFRSTRAKFELNADGSYQIKLFSSSEEIEFINLIGEHAAEAVASGAVDLNNLHRSLFALAARIGAFKEAVPMPKDEDVKVCEAPACNPTPIQVSTLRQAGSTLAPTNASVELPSLAPRQSGPKTMRKLRGTPVVRVIENHEKRIDLLPSDWALVSSVAGQKLREAIICDGKWSAMSDAVNNVVIFKDLRCFGNPIAVDTAYLLSKLA